MPTRRDTVFPSLTDSYEFESLVRDICALEWNDPYTEKFGRKGQKQYGVDIYGRPVDLNGKYRAAQCKLRTKQEQLTEPEIQAEVSDARQFPHELDTLIIVTDAPRDTHTQILIDQINQREMSRGGFQVVIWFWDNITERLATYPKLIVKYYPDFYASLTTLPTVERLVDTPLQVVSVGNARVNTPLSIEEALRLRGIRFLEPSKLRIVSANPSLNDALPDGVVCSYSTSFAETTDATLMNFAGNVQNHIQQVEDLCPVFVMVPSSLTDPFLQSFVTLGGDPQRIRILDTALSLNEISDQILREVFRYGYPRRGSLASIDIAIRTREGKPDSILLDLDWLAKLSISYFPTPTEWEAIFVPALTAVRAQLLSPSD
ncbi:MAG: hypothetical protein MN733_14325, partial [Nitrososphaera sp.]|nr:hypothetical protein [Nitrososphaera sp.]